MYKLNGLFTNSSKKKETVVATMQTLRFQYESFIFKSIFIIMNINKLWKSEKESAERDPCVEIRFSVWFIMCFFILFNTRLILPFALSAFSYLKNDLFFYDLLVSLYTQCTRLSIEWMNEKKNIYKMIIMEINANNVTATTSSK